MELANACGDMHVEVVSRRLVKASNTSITPHVLAVSNLDLLYSNFPGCFICLYPRPPAGDFTAVLASFEATLPSFLNRFFPFAGRIVTNSTSGLPEINCSNQGAELVVGHADTTLSGLDFSSMAASASNLWFPYDRTIALSVQLVSFACGGFSVAWCSSHLLVDGCAKCAIINMWSELTRTGKLAVAPIHDRAVFCPRSPPSYGPSFGEAYTPDSDDRLVNVLTNQCGFVQRLYYVEACDVERLRQAASRGGGGHVATRMEAVSVYLWKALATVIGSGDERCRMGWWVNGRRCVASGADRTSMDAYMGNATSFAVREAGVEEILHAACPDVAAMVRDAIAATAKEEHFQDLVDWMEEHKPKTYLEAATVGLGSPTVTVTWVASFRLDTDFGFGKAMLAMPAMLSGRQCSTYLVVTEHPGGDRSLFISAFLWPKLAAALESSEGHIFKPVTAEYLGFRP
ncbi:unnamed protein product [Urochloa humidicola]